MNEWPTFEEIRKACSHLWTGDQTQHEITVMCVLGEIRNIRRQETNHA